MKNTNKPEVTQPGELERRRLIKRIDYTIEQAVQSGLITPGELNKLHPIA